MSNNSLPKVPVRFNPHNEELVKAQEGLAGQREGATNFNEEIPYAEVPPGVQPSYRTPPDRVLGNKIFRRYINGRLDVRYAKDKVIDALHRSKDSGGIDQLNSEEKTALSVLFPNQFDFVEPTMVDSVAAVHLRLSTEEVEEVRQAVAAHLAEEMNWNAGLGGNSVPGRHQTRS